MALYSMVAREQICSKKHFTQGRPSDISAARQIACRLCQFLRFEQQKGRSPETG